MSETVQSTGATIAELGHGARFVEVTKTGAEQTRPKVYGCMYWGNQDGKVGISGVLEFPFCDKARAWVNEENGVGVDVAGDLVASFTPADEAMKFSVYLSPNVTDVTLFISAFLVALGCALRPETGG